MRKQIFSETEWITIKKDIFDLLTREETVEEMDNSTIVFEDAEWAPLEESNNQSSVLIELEMYIAERRVPEPSPSNHTFSCALNFWKENEKKYKRLSKLARKFFSISPSSAEPERIFSNLTHLLDNPRRANLTDDSIADLMDIRMDIALRKVEANRKKNPEFEELEYPDSSSADSDVENY